MKKDILTPYYKAKQEIIKEFYRLVYEDEEELTDHYFHDMGSCIMLNDDYWDLDDIIEAIEE